MALKGEIVIDGLTQRDRTEKSYCQMCPAGDRTERRVHDHNSYALLVYFGITLMSAFSISSIENSLQKAPN